MPKKKHRPAQKKPKPALGLVKLRARVEALETDFNVLKADMDNLSDELGSLRTTVKQVDDRTLRGEKLMLEMQGEQLKISRTIDRIALHLNVTPESSPAKQKEVFSASELAPLED